MGKSNAQAELIKAGDAKTGISRQLLGSSEDSTKINWPYFIKLQRSGNKVSYATAVDILYDEGVITSDPVGWSIRVDGLYVNVRDVGKEPGPPFFVKDTDLIPYVEERFNVAGGMHYDRELVEVLGGMIIRAVRL
jgi:hypothetical protein